MVKRIFTDAAGQEHQSPYPAEIPLVVGTEHIRAGIRGTTDADPFAQAARTLFPNWLRIRIFDDYLELHADWRHTIWEPTDPAGWRDWLWRYHTGQAVESCRFVLRRVFEEETEQEHVDILRRYGSS